ncbi:MAG: alanine racemase [Micromonosporaceae bacterium]|nr:alanine racemase [Micromonosporaceae bacterium]
MVVLLSDPLPSATASGARLSIDTGAIAANTELFAARAGGALMAVVKADGYGHGAALVARTALRHGAGWIGVTSIAEALRLREAGITAPVLSWLNPIDADFAAALAGRIDLAVPSLEHLGAIEAAAARTGCAARIHLYIDCGMARDGAGPRVWPRLCRRATLAQRRGLLRVVGVMGHLGCAETPADACNRLGRRRFSRAVSVARGLGLRPGYRHLAATTATLTDPRAHHTMCRVGAGLVGIDLSGSTPLRPAMTLRAPIVSVRQVPAGTPVGYGHAWRTPAATRLGLIPIGYADGIPRRAGNRAWVAVRGRRCRVVGRVSMDQTVLDLGPIDARPGEWATVFGPGEHGEPSIVDWAQWTDTIPHEIVTGIGDRVQR